MPPDLSQAARPLAANPPQGCGEADISSPPSPHSTAEHCSRNGGGLQLPQEFPASSRPTSDRGREEQVGSEARTHVGADGVAVTPSASIYHLSPSLRTAFASVGATNRAYSFREVLCLLKKYLFSKIHLFDAKDKLYVNCGCDALGQAFKVERFHFDDVRSLIARNITRVEPESCHISLHGPAPVPDISLRNSHSRDCRVAHTANDNTSGLLVSSAAATCSSGNTSAKSHKPWETQYGPGNEYVAGPLVVCDSKRALPGSIDIPPEITCPDIPDSCSDTESIYSIQGYETEYCRNTEYESNEEEDVVEVNSETYEEYELPSDDNREEKEHSSDSDSTIDDVEIAVLAYTLVQDEEEEGFYADDSDSDSDDQSNDDSDPELVSDGWACVSCGLRNKPFVRYCGKCWKLRKNWLPDRPKKRKRKPRPKKRSIKRRTESIVSEDPCGSQDTSRLKDQELLSVGGSDSSSQPEELASTSMSQENACSNYSQDSGISSSQDLIDDMSAELTEDKMKTQGNTTKVSQFEKSASGSKEQVSLIVRKSDIETEPKASSSRKRKPSSGEDYKYSKRPKTIEEDRNEICGDLRISPEDMSTFIQSSAGKAWLKSPDPKNLRRYFMASPAMQEKWIEKLEDHTGVGSASGFSMLCSVCCLRPKNASIIHGRLSHQATCYQCARRLLNAGDRCPVCRRKIHMVCKHIVA